MPSRSHDEPVRSNVDERNLIDRDGTGARLSVAAQIILDHANLASSPPALLGADGKPLPPKIEAAWEQHVHNAMGPEDGRRRVEMIKRYIPEQKRAEVACQAADDWAGDGWTERFVAGRETARKQE